MHAFMLGVMNLSGTKPSLSLDLVLASPHLSSLSCQVLEPQRVASPLTSPAEEGLAGATVRIPVEVNWTLLQCAVWGKTDSENVE